MAEVIVNIKIPDDIVSVVLRHKICQMHFYKFTRLCRWTVIVPTVRSPG